MFSTNRRRFIALVASLTGITGESRADEDCSFSNYVETLESGNFSALVEPASWNIVMLGESIRGYEANKDPRVEFKMQFAFSDSSGFSWPEYALRVHIGTFIENRTWQSLPIEIEAESLDKQRDNYTFKSRNFGSENEPLYYWTADLQGYQVKNIIDSLLESKVLVISVYDPDEKSIMAQAKHSLDGLSDLYERVIDVRRELETQYVSRCKKNGGGGEDCFLTTACCKVVGLPDNCWELRTARRFRDEWMAQTYRGREMISDYYRLGPQLVARIGDSSDAKSFLLKCYIFYVLPMCLLAQLGLNQSALRIYLSLITKIKNTAHMKIQV